MTIKITEKDGIYYAGNVVSSTYAIEQDLINRGKAILLDRDNYDDAEWNSTLTALVDPVTGKALSTLGTNSFTVGIGGQYPTASAAAEAIKLLPQFTETTIPGTVTMTLNSSVITGVGTNFLTTLKFATHISITTGGIRKWYPLAKEVTSDTSAHLDFVYADTTATGASAVSAVAIHYTMLLLEDDLTVELFAGQSNVAANIHVDAMGHRVKAVTAVINSGLFELANSPSVDSIGLSGTGGFPVADCYITNVRRAESISSSAEADWAVINTGRLYSEQVRCKGNFDVFVTSLVGGWIITNTELESYALTVSDSSQVWATNLSAPNGVMRCTGSQFILGATGTGTTNAINLGSSFIPEKCKFYFNNCDVILQGLPGATAQTSLNVFLGSVVDSDIYLNDCRVSVDSTITPPSAWKMFAHDAGIIGQIANRIHIQNTSLPDLQSTTTQMVITTLKGDMGVKTITSSAGAFTANQLSAIRASTFHATLTENITSIPSVLNAPDGTEVGFVFTQDATAGRTIGWNAVYKFAAAWVQAALTTDANKVSTVRFKKRGSNWYQISPANVWL